MHPRLRSSFGNYSLPTNFNCLSEQWVGGLEGCIGLPALQPCTLSLSLAWQRGAWAPCL